MNIYRKSTPERDSPLDPPQKNTPEKYFPSTRPRKSIRGEDSLLTPPQKNTPEKDSPLNLPKKVSGKRIPHSPILKKIPPERTPLRLILKKISSKRKLLYVSLEKISLKKKLRLPDLKKMDQKRIHGQRMTLILATNRLGDETPIHAPTKEGIQAGVEQDVLGRGEIRVGVENAKSDVAGCAEDAAILSQIGDAKR